MRRGQEKKLLMNSREHIHPFHAAHRRTQADIRKWQSAGLRQITLPPTCSDMLYTGSPLESQHPADKGMRFPPLVLQAREGEKSYHSTPSSSQI